MVELVVQGMGDSGKTQEKCRRLEEANRLLSAQLVSVQETLVQLAREKRGEASPPGGEYGRGKGEGTLLARKGLLSASIQSLLNSRVVPGGAIRSNICLIRQSSLFNAKWYVEKYPDVAKAGIDPARHYLVHGFKEGRNPGPGFDTRWYLKQYPDIAKSNVNPLIHFIQFGQHEGRKPMPGTAFGNGGGEPTLSGVKEGQAGIAERDAKEILRLNKLLAERESQISSMQELIAGFADAKTKLECQITDLKVINATLSERISSAENEIDELTARGGLLREELIKAEGQFDLIRKMFFSKELQ